MQIIPQSIFLLIFLASKTVVGQDLSQGAVIKIVRLAFEQNKLPNELVPRLDSISELSFPDPMIIIKSDPKLKLIREYDQTDNKKKVMIWAGEDLFLYNILYCMTPVETSVKKNKATIKYRTTPLFGRRPGVTYKCFKGEIKAAFDGTSWTIVKSQFVEDDCLWISGEK